MSLNNRCKTLAAFCWALVDNACKIIGPFELGY